jgi:predicted ATPase
LDDPDELGQRFQNFLIGCKLYHFEDTSLTAKVKGLGDIELGAVLNEDASNLAAFLYTMREVQRPYYDRLVSVIRSVAPFLDDFVLAPRALNNAEIQLRWRHVNQEGEFTAHALSDGTLRFICLATLLLQPRLPPLILLDEPELGLHPHAVWTLASLLKSASQSSQLIVATQSATLVDQMDFSNILAVERENNESNFFWLDSVEHLKAWLEDYTVGQMWEMNLYGGIQSVATHINNAPVHTD